jgi:hypothetical protein
MVAVEGDARVRQGPPVAPEGGDCHDRLPDAVPGGDAGLGAGCARGCVVVASGPDIGPMGGMGIVRSGDDGSGVGGVQGVTVDVAQAAPCVWCVGE